MKKKFLVVTLWEASVVTTVSLFDELNSEQKHTVIRTVEDSKDTELEAVKLAEEIVEGVSDHEFVGVEITPVFVKA